MEALHSTDKHVDVRLLFVMGVTFLIGIFLSILPFPTWAIWLRPDWMALLVIVWSLLLPRRLGLITVWLLGLCLDVLLGSLLGEHALALSVVAYFCARFHLRINSLFFQRKITMIFLVILLYKLVLFWVQGLIGQLPHPMLYWVSALTSILIYPWLFILLKDYSRFKKEI